MSVSYSKLIRRHDKFRRQTTDNKVTKFFRIKQTIGGTDQSIGVELPGRGLLQLYKIIGYIRLYSLLEEEGQADGDRVAKAMTILVVESEAQLERMQIVVEFLPFRVAQRPLDSIPPFGTHVRLRDERFRQLIPAILHLLCAVWENVVGAERCRKMLHNGRKPTEKAARPLANSCLAATSN